MTLNSGKTQKAKRIFFLAGEQSGDLHGCLVIEHLKKMQPDLQIDGIGGPMMKAAGMNCIHTSEELAVIGFVEVLKNIRHLYKILTDVESRFKQHRPDMVVLIDYPGFNQRVASLAKKMGIHVLYYICPQVWAWNPGRVKKITKLIDEALVVFHFEEEIWAKAGAVVSWYGHPLVGIAKPTDDYKKLLEEYSLNKSPLVSLLPGSRNQEIYYIFSEMLQTAELILKQRPDVKFLLPVADTIDDVQINSYLNGKNLPIRVLRGQTYNAIAASDLCLVASGTATLETAIIGTPLIVVYRVNWLTSMISKYVVQAPHIGLPNVIAGKRIVPEFIRETFRADLIANEAVDILNNPDRQTKMRDELKIVREKLGSSGASVRVAEHISRRIMELQKQ